MENSEKKDAPDTDSLKTATLCKAGAAVTMALGAFGVLPAIAVGASLYGLNKYGEKIFEAIGDKVEDMLRD